jgi:predicted RNase H-like nuclease (RuvC/YqgF family)
MWRWSRDPTDLPTLQQQLPARPRLPGEEGEMSDEELVKRLRDDVNGEHDMTPHGADCLQAADRIEALTEQLEAARADAKEAESYADGLEKEIELNEQEACMLENDLIKADKEIDDLKVKLAKAVELAKEAIETMASGPFFPDEEERRLLSKLAEIEGEKG